MGTQMNPETRAKHLYTVLGWQGGTIHDACREIGLDPYDFLCGSVEMDFFDRSVNPHFKLGYLEAINAKSKLKEQSGNLQYWLGVVSAVQNDYEMIDSC